MMNFIYSIIEHFSSYAAWIAFFAAFSETLIGLGFFIPGSTLLLVLGMLAGQGYLDIKSVFFFSVIGAYIGDIANFGIGKRYGLSLIQNSWLRLPSKTINSAHHFLQKHGNKAVFFARFLPGLKESVPFLAGTLGMSRYRFMIWDFFGALGWSMEFVGIGYLFSTSLSLAQAWLSRTLIVVTVFILLLFVLFLLKLFILRNAPIAASILHSLWNAFLSNEHVANGINRFPKLIAFLQKRFDKRSFTGRPLTFLFLIFLLFLALFAGIVEDLLTKDPIVYIDHIVANLVVQWRTPELTRFFTWVTYLGTKEIVLCLLLTATAILLLHKKINEVLALWFSFSGSVLFIYFGKLLFHRPRPDTALYFESTYSFPSGHAVIAISLYAFLGLLLARHVHTFRQKVNILFASIVLVILIGGSRIYLGEHYLSDVYGGYLLGLAWLTSAYALLGWLDCQKFFRPLSPFSHAKFVSWILGTIFIVCLLLFAENYHYQPLPKTKPSPSVFNRVSELQNYFAKEANLFTRNLLGMKSIPIAMVIIHKKDESPCALLAKEGWHHSKTENVIDLPIFWHSKSSACSLYKKMHSSWYLIKIWPTNLQFKKMKIDIVAMDAITGYRWNFIPVWTVDLPSVRKNLLKQIAEVFPGGSAITLTETRPFIANRFDGSPYFFDGKIIMYQVGPVQSIDGRKVLQNNTVGNF